MGIFVGHQSDINSDPKGPAVDSHNQLEDVFMVFPGEQENKSHDDHQNPEQAAKGIGAVFGVAIPPAGQSSQNRVVRYGQKPFEQHQPVFQGLRIFNLQIGRVIGGLDRKGRIDIGSQGSIGVETYSPAPAQHTDVEVKHSAGVTAGEKNREKGDHGHEGKGNPEKTENYGMGNDQQPFYQPQASTQRFTELSF